MKKTLITLLALAGVAAHGAENLTTLDSDLLTVADVKVGTINGSDNLDAGNNVLVWDTGKVSSPSTSYILTFSFNQFRAGDLDAFFRLGGSDGYGLATQDGNTMKLATSRTEVTGNAFSINTSDTYALTMTTIGDVGYAIISNLTTQTSQEIEIADLDDGSFNITSGTTRVWTNTDGDNKIRLKVGEIADLSDLSLSQIREVAKTGSYTIPEPTTATLSLLALAGLAARRRRK